MSANPVQRENRRRRVLRDETTEVRKSVRPVTKGGRRYTEAALEDAQLRLTDLLPRATWKLGAVVGAGLLAIVSLQVAYIWQAGDTSTGQPVMAPAFNLGSYGSLGSWFAAVTMLGCALMSLLIYNTRRHRIADYRGRYRLWTWAAIVFFVASMDAVAGIGHLTAGLMLKITGGHVLHTQAAWVFAGWAVIGLTIAVPMLLELRMSQTTLAGLLSAGISYAGAGLLYVQVFRASSTVGHWSLHTSLLFTAHLLLFASLWAFARLVFLDAQGELVRKERKPPKEIVAPQWVLEWRARQAERRAAKKDGEEPKKKTKLKRVKKQKATVKMKPVESDDHDEPEAGMDASILENPDLTKAERRKLKRQLKMQQRRAA